MRPEPARLAWALVAVLLATSPVAARPASGPIRLGMHGPASGIRLECDDCHGSHATPRRPDGIGMWDRSSTCLDCHSGARAPGGDSRAGSGRLAGTAVAPDVESQLRKPSQHPFEAPEARLQRRALRAKLPRLPSQLDAEPRSRALACTDCHDPHARVGPRPGGAGPGGTSGQLLTSDGQVVADSEFCYRCHATARRGEAGSVPGRDVQSLLLGGNASAHPVDALVPPRGTPGLLAGVYGARMGCGDCHGSDEGSAVRGPHGSAHAPLLVRAYGRDDGEPESPRRYALCYGCHDRGVLLGPESGFPQHRLHVVDAQASCAACHDAHGSPDLPHLLRFDSSLVTPGSAGAVAFEAAPNGIGGTCSLTCHSRDHVRVSY